MRKAPPNKIDWSESHIQFLKKNFFKKSNRELANHLGLRLTSVRSKCYEMGLKKMELEYWTEEQVEFLKENYKIMGDVEIAEIFQSLYYKQKGWTKKHIEKKRKHMNLKRTTEERAAIQHRNVAAGRFSINHWKRWANRITPVGEIRIWKNTNNRPVMVIRTEFGFVHYAPWLYQKEFGPIPEGFIVRLKDDNPLNVVPENLKLVTRSEHAVINSKNRIQYPEELKETMRILNKLTKKINSYGNEKQN